MRGFKSIFKPPTYYPHWVVGGGKYAGQNRVNLACLLSSSSIRNSPPGSAEWEFPWGALQHRTEFYPVWPFSDHLLTMLPFTDHLQYYPAIPKKSLVHRYPMAILTPVSKENLERVREGEHSKSPPAIFLGLFIFPLFSVLLYFLGLLAISRRWKELPEIRGCQSDRIF